MANTVLRVNSPGLLSLVQDLGRRGYQRYGVSVSGAADAEALHLGNRLTGNPADAAAVEITFGGAEFEFLQPAVFAVTGGDLAPSLNGEPLPRWQSLLAGRGDVLAFAGAASGLRAYLCIAGGIAVEPVLTSRATHIKSKLGGLDGGPLKVGDELPVGEFPPSAEPGLAVPQELRPAYSHELRVRVVPGPQEEMFTPAGIETFYGSVYTVTDRSDRQGLRLDGPAIEAVDGRYDIVSDAVVMGSIQVPGDAKPIMLMADRQTTGGYPKIATVASVDLPKLAQALPGAALSFVRCTVEEAEAMARERRRRLRECQLVRIVESSRFSVAMRDGPLQVELATTEHTTSAVFARVGGRRLLMQVETEPS